MNNGEAFLRGGWNARNKTTPGGHPMTEKTTTTPRQIDGWRIAIRAEGHEDLHRRFKIATAVRGETQQDALVKIIDAYCKEAGQ